MTAGSTRPPPDMAATEAEAPPREPAGTGVLLVWILMAAGGWTLFVLLGWTLWHIMKGGT